uniref:acyl-CoA thioesterase n=1 Tax=Streptomyces polyasparticus TaxID=2767826 RepID=UPI00280BC3A7|nr:thioesterase family protein [Streptomyces polyasparticus]
MRQYTYPCPLRWADADSYGHINNALFLRYMEEARTRMFQELLSADEGSNRRNAFVVSRSVIDHRAPLHYRDEPVNVHVRVAGVSAATFELTYEICDADRKYAEASTSIVAYNLESERPRRLSVAERTFLSRFAAV